MSSFSGAVLVIGGRGALGSKVIGHFQGLGYWVTSVDRGENSTSVNFSISIGNHDEMEQQVHSIRESLEKSAQSKFDAIICVAGGWAGGNLRCANFLANVTLMWGQSVVSSLVAAALATSHLREGGLLILTGAAAALAPTPGMIAYGMAKAAVHNLVKSLGESESGLPEGAKTLAILPGTLDTPNNRKAMPDADTGTWTSLEFVANLIQGWIENVKDAPKSGSLVALITKDGNTVTEIK